MGKKSLSKKDRFQSDKIDMVEAATLPTSTSPKKFKCPKCGDETFIISPFNSELEFLSCHCILPKDMVK